MDVEAYHRMELRIALDGADSRRAMPVIPPGVTSILDVGCGAGQTLIASRLRPAVRAVGVDPDFEALALGRRLGAPVHLVHACGESLPFAADSFDMVISRVAVPYMRRGSALAEMARVLRPGGHALLVVGDGIVDDRPEHAPDAIAEAGAPVGLEPVARASQARPIHDRRLAQIFAGQPRREHLLLLRRRG